jgi:hypothetical protein
MLPAIWSRRLFLLLFVPAIMAASCPLIKGKAAGPCLEATQRAALHTARPQQDMTPIETAVTEECQADPDGERPTLDPFRLHRTCFPDMARAAERLSCFWHYTLSTCHNATALNPRAPPPVPA